MFAKGGDYRDAKVFCEGNGLMHETKNKDPKLRWKKVGGIFTSNDLPDILEKQIKYTCEPAHKFKAREAHHKAFMTRIKFTEMTEEFENS